MAEKTSRRSTGASGPKVDPNAWMVTFSDLIMLLLTFFVMLLTMKSMDTKAYKKIFDRVAHTSGPLFYNDITDEIGNMIDEPYMGKAIMISSSEELEEHIELMASLEQLPIRNQELDDLKRMIEITENDQAVIIGMVSDDIFKSGDAQIRPDRLDILDSIGHILLSSTNDIIIMGHTDNVPIQAGPFKSNWELSLYRALSVLYYLSDHIGISPERLAAGGYGEVLPQGPNDTEKNRAGNRRVEFILKKR